MLLFSLMVGAVVVAVFDGFAFFVFLVVVVVPVAVPGEPSCAFSVKTSEDLLSDFLPILQECCCFVVAGLLWVPKKMLIGRKAGCVLNIQFHFCFLFFFVWCHMSCDRWSHSLMMVQFVKHWRNRRRILQAPGNDVN